VLKLYSTSANSGVFSSMPSKAAAAAAAAAAASAAAATGSKALQFLGLRSQPVSSTDITAPKEDNNRQQQQQQQLLQPVAQSVT
jgi:hypothetical protein